MSRWLQASKNAGEIWRFGRETRFLGSIVVRNYGRTMRRGDMSLEGQVVAFIAHPGFDVEEFRELHDCIAHAGATIVILGAVEHETLTGNDGRTKVRVQTSFLKAAPGVYDALIIFGERMPRRLMSDGAVLRLVRAVNEAGRLVVAVDRGPLLLVAAGFAKGRIMTGWPTTWPELRRAGAFAPAAPISVDGNLLTVMGPEHAHDACLLIPRMIEHLQKRRAS